MMDGRVGAIRDGARRARASPTLPILSYAAKYASAFYGPFREAADSAPQFGDRRGYQMDPANVREALREVRLDVEEGADIVMVKPALPYLDVIRAVPRAFDRPVAAYNVSGEYAMVKAAAARAGSTRSASCARSLTSIRRAGADVILTYHAKDFARQAGLDAHDPVRGSCSRARKARDSRAAYSARCAPSRRSAARRCSSARAEGAAHLGRGRPRRTSTTSARGGR